MRCRCERLLLRSGLDDWRAEAAHVELSARAVYASRIQLGSNPVPYRLDYNLDASEDFVTRILHVVTRILHVEVTGDGWKRRIRLTHDGDGGWKRVTELSAADET